MLHRDPQDATSAEVDPKALYDRAHADTRSGPKFVLLSADEEAWLQRLDSDDAATTPPKSD